jgi:hypothetical protein
MFFLHGAQRLPVDVVAVSKLFHYQVAIKIQKNIEPTSNQITRQLRLTGLLGNAIYLRNQNFKINMKMGSFSVNNSTCKSFRVFFFEKNSL